MVPQSAKTRTESLLAALETRILILADIEAGGVSSIGAQICEHGLVWGRPCAT